MAQNWMMNDGGTEFGDGIHLRSRRGPIGVAWWSRRWMDLVEAHAEPQELEVGRRLARRSVVLECDFEPGLCTGRVAETREQVGYPSIPFPIISESAWDTILNAIKTDALSIARIYARKLPDNIEAIFDEAGVQLLPEEMPRSNCTCDTAFKLCRHTIALACVMAERFDEQPANLFHLLGKSRNELCNAIRASWDMPPLRDAKEKELPPKLSSLGDTFYRGQERMPENSGTLDLKEIDALECLGYPPFFPPTDRSVMQTLRELYRD